MSVTIDNEPYEKDNGKDDSNDDINNDVKVDGKDDNNDEMEIVSVANLSIEQDQDWKPDCVICRTDNKNGTEMVRLKCCENAYIHNSCLQEYFKSGQNQRCPLCNELISVTKDYVYTTKDKYYRYDVEFYGNLLNVFFFVARIFLFVFTIIQIVNTYYDQEEYKRICLILTYVIISIVPSGFIFIMRVTFFRCWSYDTKERRDNKSDKELIKYIFQDKGNLYCALCGFTLRPDNKYFYFRPLYGSCCTNRYELTKCNWIKLYFIQMILYVFLNSLLDLIYVYLVKYEYLTFTSHITLQLVTWLIINTSCLCSGDNYCRKMTFKERTVTRTM